jgi:TetR/AcrR family transcriptional regulator of autoinduction and epiphytic fitness
MMEETVPLKHIPYSPKRPLTAQLGAFADAKLAVVKNPTWLGTMKVTVGVFISNPNLAREVMKLAEDEEDYLVTWLEAADADGRLNVPDPTFAADLFWSMVSGALFWPVLFFGAHSIAKTKALKKEIIDMFLTRYAV